MEVREQHGWGITSKPKAQNPEQHFEDSYVFFEFQAAVH